MSVELHKHLPRAIEMGKIPQFLVDTTAKGITTGTFLGGVYAACKFGERIIPLGLSDHESLTKFVYISGNLVGCGVSALFAVFATSTVGNHNFDPAGAAFKGAGRCFRLIRRGNYLLRESLSDI
jgi:hypothetical protein